MRPYDTDTEDKVVKQKQDNTSSGQFYILADGKHVILGVADEREPMATSIAIPRKDFNALVDWYMRDQEARVATTPP